MTTAVWPSPLGVPGVLHVLLPVGMSLRVGLGPTGQRPPRPGLPDGHLCGREGFETPDSSGSSNLIEGCPVQ